MVKNSRPKTSKSVTAKKSKQQATLNLLTVAVIMTLLAFCSSATAYGQIECPNPGVFTQTEDFGNPQDMQALETASARCAYVTKGRSPCLKVFVKQEQGKYQAICGKPNQGNIERASVLTVSNSGEPVAFAEAQDESAEQGGGGEVALAAGRGPAADYGELAQD